MKEVFTRNNVDKFSAAFPIAKINKTALYGSQSKQGFVMGWKFT